MTSRLSWHIHSVLFQVEQSLLFLNKFQDLEGLKIDFADKYSKLMQNFSKELDTVRKIYEKNKEDPPLSRNLPPTAGRIIWARQLYQRISMPIKLLQEKIDLNKTEEGRSLIKNFNKIAEALLQYEVLFYRNWERSIDLIKKGMQATVYIRHPETKVGRSSPSTGPFNACHPCLGGIRQFRSSSLGAHQRCSVPLETRLGHTRRGHDSTPARRTDSTDECETPRATQRRQADLCIRPKRHASVAQTPPGEGRRSPSAWFRLDHLVIAEDR